jgi:hypothetical protein
MVLSMYACILVDGIVMYSFILVDGIIHVCMCSSGWYNTCIHSCILVDSVKYEFVNSREWYYTHVHIFYWMVCIIQGFKYSSGRYFAFTVFMHSREQMIP